MRVVLVIPESFAIGAEYLSAVLRQRGHDCDLVIDPLPFQDQFLSMGALSAPFRNLRGMLRRVIRLRPDVVGFTVVTDLYPWFRQWADALRAVSAVPIVAGGVHPNLRPDEVMEQSAVSHVLLGECEASFPLYLEHLSGERAAEDVPGLVWRQGTLLRKNPRPDPPEDLDALPFPDKRAWLAEGYNNRYPIVGARGCPYACTYCYVPTWRDQNPGAGVRQRSVRNVVDEIHQARRQASFRSVSFLDDIFVYRRGWLREFSDVYARELGLPFFAYGHANCVNEEVVALLRRAGCTTVTLGFQTYSEHLKKKVLDRPEPNWKVARAIRLLKDAGIFANVDVILGIPGQDVEEVRNIARFLNENRVDGVNVHWLRYYPDAPILRHLSESDRAQAQQSLLFDEKFFFRGSEEEARLTFLMYLTLLLPRAAVDRLLERGGYRRLPPLAGFTLNFPVSMIRGPVTGRRRLPVQNDTPSMLRKYVKYAGAAAAEHRHVRAAKQAAFVGRTFVGRPDLRRTAQLGRHAWRRHALGLERPVSVVFAVTYACPLGCVHCSVERYKSRKVFTTGEANGVLDSLAEFGVAKVAFFGGEPTVRKDVPELVAHAGTLGMRTSLDTAGIRIDEAYADRLLAAGIQNVNVSLDHPDEAEHDRNRRYPGAWASARNAVALLRARGVPVVIGTYATKAKIRDGSMVRLVETARAWGASGIKILHPILSGRYFEEEAERLTRRDMDYLHLLADPSFVYLEDAYELYKPDNPSCSSLKKQFFYLAPDGEVQPCPGIPISFGSLREEAVETVVGRMWAHRMFADGTESCDTCLANDLHFRHAFLRTIPHERLPVRIDEIERVAAAAK